MSSTADRIRAMDEQGIDVEALSIPTGRQSDREQVSAPERDPRRSARPQPGGSSPATVALRIRTSPPSSSSTVSRNTACGRRPRRQRRRPRVERPQVSSVLGQGRAARRPRVHPPSGHGRAGADGPARGQWPAHQYHRQSARDDDRAVAPHLRRHPRSLPRPQDLRRARRRLPALVRRAVQRGADDLSPPHDRDAQEKADGVPAPALLRFIVHAQPCAIWRGDGPGQIIMGTDYPFRGRARPWTTS